jgi:hypothetical protein
VDPSLASLLDPEAVERFWARIRSKMVPQPVADPSPHHSAGIVAVDEQGNVACILHSGFRRISAAPDPRSGPWHAPAGVNQPLIVLKGGKPVLASVAIGWGLHNVTIENLINILDFGMDPQTAVNQPNTRGPFVRVIANAPGKPEYEKEAIVQG